MLFVLPSVQGLDAESHPERSDSGGPSPGAATAGRPHLPTGPVRAPCCKRAFIRADRHDAEITMLRRQLGRSQAWTRTYS